MKMEQTKTQLGCRERERETETKKWKKTDCVIQKWVMDFYNSIFWEREKKKIMSRMD